MDANKLSRFVLEALQEKRIEKDMAVSLIKKFNEREDIAIIGMGCRLSEADNYDEYWDLMLNKKMTVKRCPNERIDLIKTAVPKMVMKNELKYSKGSYYKDIDMFDSKFFPMEEQEAKDFGPGHRMMLQTVYSTLEDAGYLGEANEGNKTGVFLGTNFSRDMLYSYSGVQMRQYMFGFTFDKMIGNWSSGLATKMALMLNLKGGAYMIDAGCPSSAIGIYNACMALKTKQCNMAVAGGLTLELVPLKFLGGGGSMFSHDDNVVSRTYDKYPGGAFAGEACAAVLLKPLDKALEDGDRIHGIICGSSFANNGSDGAFMQSSPEDVKKATITGIKNAQISAEDIEFLEGEGIVNKIEEGIELSGIINAFKSFGDKRQYCAMGSLSPNFGYLQAPIGALQVIKICMALQNETLPPQIHFSEPTDMVNFIKSPFYINTEPRKWERRENKPRYAGIFGYGYGGNDLFTVVSEAPVIQKQKEEEGREELFVLTAATKKSFDQYIKKYVDFLSDESNDMTLSQICYTASVCRLLKDEYRLAVVVKDKESLVKALKQYSTEGKTADNMFIGNENPHSQKNKIKKEPIKEMSLEEAAQSFCKGSNFVFKDLYEGRHIMRCKLPSYPFDKSKYWAIKLK